MADSVCHAPAIFQWHFKLFFFSRNLWFSQTNNYSLAIWFRVVSIYWYHVYHQAWLETLRMAQQASPFLRCFLSCLVNLKSKDNNMVFSIHSLNWICVVTNHLKFATWFKEQNARALYVFSKNAVVSYWVKWNGPSKWNSKLGVCLRCQALAVPIGPWWSYYMTVKRNVKPDIYLFQINLRYASISRRSLKLNIRLAGYFVAKVSPLLIWKYHYFSIVLMLGTFGMYTWVYSNSTLVFLRVLENINLSPRARGILGCCSCLP